MTVSHLSKFIKQTLILSSELLKTLYDVNKWQKTKEKIPIRMTSTVVAVWLKHPEIDFTGMTTA